MSTVIILQKAGPRQSCKAEEVFQNPLISILDSVIQIGCRMGIRQR